MRGKRSTIFLLFIPFTLGASPAARGAPDTLFVAGDVSKSVVKIGERVTVSLSLARPDSSARLIGPPAPMGFEAVDVVASEPLETAADSVGWTMDIAFFRLGELDLTGIPFVLETDRERIPVRLRPYSISVESVLPDTLGDADIRDIHGPLDVPLRVRWSRVVIGSIALLALIAGFVFWRRFARRQPEPAIPLVPEIPPEARALRDLAALEEAALPARGLTKEHYARLSLILREYMEGRFRVTAVESTTDEIRESLERRKPIRGEASRTILDLLAEADLVKFARYRRETGDAAAALANGREWVRAVAPSAEEGSP